MTASEKQKLGAVREKQGAKSSLKLKMIAEIEKLKEKLENFILDKITWDNCLERTKRYDTVNRILENQLQSLTSEQCEFQKEGGKNQRNNDYK